MRQPSLKVMLLGKFNTLYWIPVMVVQVLRELGAADTGQPVTDVIRISHITLALAGGIIRKVTVTTCCRAEIGISIIEVPNMHQRIGGGIEF